MPAERTPPIVAAMDLAFDELASLRSQLAAVSAERNNLAGLLLRAEQIIDTCHNTTADSELRDDIRTSLRAALEAAAQEPKP